MADILKYVSLANLTKYDEKIKEHIASADAALKTDLEGQVNVVANALDGEIARAKAAEQTNANAAAAAQTAVDNLSEYVGTFTASDGVDTVVKYIDAKTANIASDETVNALTERVTQAESDIDAIEADYLKAADKTELSNAIAAEAETARAAENANADAIDAIEADYLKAADKTELQGNIDAVDAKVATLVGEDANKSVRTIANEELAAQLIGENAKESLDTLAEIAAWIQSHPDDASAMNEAIVALQNKVDTGDKTVSAYVTDAIAALSIGDYAKAADLTALAGRVSTLETASATHATKDEVTAVSDALTEYKNAHASDYTNAQVDSAISGAIDAERAEIDAELAKKVDKVDGYGLSKNDLTDALKANYDAAYAHSQVAHAPADAQANIIESVKVNGAALTVTGKAVDIAVPTKVSELTNDVPYLVAADIANKADKATTLAGYGITDAYTNAQTDTAIANAMAQFVECSEEDINGLFSA